ncbi:MAG: class I SAM-dependent methyltransferase [Acidobacteriota bacterium]
MELPANEVEFPNIWYSLGDENHFWFEWRLAVLMDELRNRGVSLDAPLKVLDIGCGHGILGTQLDKSTRWLTHGVDLNTEALKLNRRNRDQFSYYDIHDRKPELCEAYDCVFLFDILEHIDDTDHFVESALYYLKPNGWLFINVPALRALYSRYDTVAGHIRRYDKEMLTKLFGRFDAVVENLRYWGASMIPFLLARKALVTIQQSGDDVIRTGFEPPSDMVHRLFKGLMRLETSTIKDPPRGTSLMASIRKGS